MIDWTCPWSTLTPGLAEVEAANGEFSQQTVGRMAVCSHDGTRLALHGGGGGRVLVLNMINAPLWPTASYPAEHRKGLRSTDWLAGWLTD